METTTDILDSFDTILERFELCTKHKLLKMAVLVISFILGTIDMVTDWMNWKQWSTYGGYDQHYFVSIFQTAFLVAALMGTILWVIEAFLMIHRCRGHIRKYQKKFKTKEKETVKNMQKNLPSKLSFIVRLLIGLMEDFPLILLLYYSVVIPFCGRPTALDSSPTTIATVVSSMLNSIWTLLILYWDLFGCYKKLSNAECCCTMMRAVYEPQTLLCVCYCG